MRALSARAGYLADRLSPTAPPEVALRMPTPHELWLVANGDKVLRMEYSLSCHDIVFDVGGYEGQWARGIYSRYLCTFMSLGQFRNLPKVSGTDFGKMEIFLYISVRAVAKMANSLFRLKAMRLPRRFPASKVLMRRLWLSIRGATLTK